jgi:hypothetical protein
MNLQDEGRQLRIEISKLRADRRRRYPNELRGRIVDWVVRAEASGIPRTQSVAMLGMACVWRITNWQQRANEVMKGETGVALVRVDSPRNAPVPTGLALVTPTGYRVEGLALEQLTALLRELA